MRLLGRILVIIFAFLMASIAAAFVLAIGMLSSDWRDLVVLGIETGNLTAVVGLGAFFISGIALIPMLLVIALAEGFAWRSALFYAAAGLALALFIRYGLADPAPGVFDREREIMAGAGIAGGLVYWALAGRNAGRWRETR